MTRSTRQPSGSGSRASSRSTIASVTSSRSSSTRCHESSVGRDVAAHHEHELAIGRSRAASTVSIVYVGPSRSSSMRDASSPSTPSIAAASISYRCLGRRDHAPVLLPRIAGDDDEHPVEPELVAGGAGVHQMADVDRIERAAEDPDPLAAARIGSPAESTKNAA